MKKSYAKPTVEKLGSFESVTKAGVSGSSFDGNFSVTEPVPFNDDGQPIIFS